MGVCITFHSQRGGTGKTLMALNTAQIIAMNGKKVCLLDLDFRAPNLGYAFDIEQAKFWTNDFLDGTVNIEKTLIDVTETIERKDKLFISPANPSTEAIRLMSSRDRKWEMKALGRLLSLKTSLFEDRKFDYIIFDTSPGLLYSTINAIVTADICVLVVTADNLQIKGTKTMVDSVNDLFGKKTVILVNKILVGEKSFSKIETETMAKYEKLYGLSILGVVPCFCDILETGVSKSFLKDNPIHLFTKIMEEIAIQIPAFASGTVLKRWSKRDYLNKYNEEFIKKVTGLKI